VNAESWKERKTGLRGKKKISLKLMAIRKEGKNKDAAKDLVKRIMENK
jgi:hypothetical protein